MDNIRSFAADYSRRLKLDMVAGQRTIESKLYRAVLAGDSGVANIAKAELASLQMKRYQALVVRARLKRMSSETTNMTQQLQTEEFKNLLIGTSRVSHRRTDNAELQTKPFVRNFGSALRSFLLETPD